MKTAVQLCLLFLLSAVFCKDPAEGWMGYAYAQHPSGIITSIEAYWRVPSNPKRGGAFFSPWFGIESEDNLNLIQPVNPWVSNRWQIYNEYFQWQPVHNENSPSHDVRAGDLLYGKVVFEKNNSYTMYHKDINDGWSVQTNIPIQRDESGSYKKYNIIYFVMEKSQWDCDQYPPDNRVTFTDIKVEYDYKLVTPVWKTAIVDDNCNCRAHILNGTTIQITWQSQ